MGLEFISARAGGGEGQGLASRPTGTPTELQSHRSNQKDGQRMGAEGRVGPPHLASLQESRLVESWEGRRPGRRRGTGQGKPWLRRAGGQYSLPSQDHQQLRARQELGGPRVCHCIWISSPAGAQSLPPCSPAPLCSRVCSRSWGTLQAGV